MTALFRQNPKDYLGRFTGETKFERGGAGSGHFSHPGRPGEVGGSKPGKGGEGKPGGKESGKPKLPDTPSTLLGLRGAVQGITNDMKRNLKERLNQSLNPKQFKEDVVEAQTVALNVADSAIKAVEREHAETLTEADKRKLTQMREKIQDARESLKDAEQVHKDNWKRETERLSRKIEVETGRKVAAEQAGKMKQRETSNPKVRSFLEDFGLKTQPRGSGADLHIDQAIQGITGMLRDIQDLTGLKKRVELDEDELAGHHMIRPWLDGFVRALYRERRSPDAPWSDWNLWDLSTAYAHVRYDNLHKPECGVEEHVKLFLDPETKLIDKLYEFEDGDRRRPTEADFQAECKWLSNAAEKALSTATAGAGAEWVAPAAMPGSRPIPVRPVGERRRTKDGIPYEHYEVEDVEKGGPGSGNFGHVGRKGQRGGSAKDGGGAGFSTDEIEQIASNVKAAPTDPEIKLNLAKSVDVYSKTVLEKFNDGAPSTEQVKRSSIADANVKKLGAKAFEQTKGTGVEHGFMVENETGKLAGPYLRGQKNGFQIAENILEMDDDRGYTQVHTHPSGYSFSGDDFAILATFPQITRMVVFGESYRYEIEKPPGWKTGNVESVSEKWGKVVRDLDKKFQPPANPDGSRDKERDSVAWMEHSHHASGEFASKLGLKYTRTAR